MGAMLPRDDGTTSLSKTSMEKVAIAEPLVDSRRDSTCGPVIGTAAAVSDEDAGRGVRGRVAAGGAGAGPFGRWGRCCGGPVLMHPTYEEGRLRITGRRGSVFCFWKLLYGSHDNPTTDVPGRVRVS
ncbi:hypothetical protein BHE74_00016239 [Ensete ventricosum]|nr:hypothetical protein BHE74_00016239 [Ensete ventricosum]